MYTFFAGSTHRWNVLTSYLEKDVVFKRLSDTRWSAHFDAVHAWCTIKHVNKISFLCFSCLILIIVAAVQHACLNNNFVEISIVTIK